MFPMADLGDDLFHQPQTTAETLHSDYDIRDDIFAYATSVERSGKFLPKPRINNKRNPPIPSKTSAFEGASSTSQLPDAADVLMFPMPDLGDDLFHQRKTTAETLHFDSDIQDEIFAHATSIERNGKFLPKPHINNNKNSPTLSKTSVFEDPSSTKFSDAADVLMFPIPDLGDDLIHQRKTTAETLHSDSDIQDEIFARATSIERSGKFLPKPRINNNKNSPMPSKISVFEGPSSTSKCPDAANVRNDLGDDLFHQPKTTAEISGKFHPKPRINNNRNPPMPSKISASEGPSSTSKFHDIVDDEHVEKFQSEFQGITSGVSINPVDVVSEYSQLDLPPLQNESFDAHGPNFSVGDLKARSNFPIYSSEDRPCCSNINDLESQSLTENEDLDIMEGATRDDIEEPNLDECAPSIAQSDEAEKSSRKVTQRSKKLKTNIDNMARTDQNTKNSILEVDDDYGGDGFKDDDIPMKKKRKLPRKSTNKSCENESAIKEPPKKRLRHGSSRCKNAKRQVNKAFLEIPDDELDRRQLLIRDLIRLAGFKERISNKEAAALKNSFANQSAEHEQDFNGDDANEEIQQEGSKLNYHSYMKRPLQTRWSKTDTEIFYQAIRQFGTDFAMIQVLFPDRSRRQVKAKFKNEQRKHPLQIADALVHRSKDHSHFEKVIEHLKAVAEQNSKNDAGDSTAQAPDEADQNEEERMEANSKKEEDVNGFEDWDGDVHIPTKFNLSGNDFDQHSEAASEMENFWM